MKTALVSLLCFGLTWLFACRTEAPLTPVANLDSLACDQAWRQFRLAKDSVLTLRFNEEVSVISNSDTLFMKIIDIRDGCSMESSRLTYGCTATIKILFKLNHKCTYTTFYPLSVPRYGTEEGPNSITISEVPCKTNSTVSIENYKSDGTLVFYNQIFRFRHLFPFAKTDAELKTFSEDKRIYKIVLYQKVRCL